jgi:branched-chain amino acid transport system substrate-binding protein
LSRRASPKSGAECAGSFTYGRSENNYKREEEAVMIIKVSRRGLRSYALAGAVSLASYASVRAQSEDIVLAGSMPLTGVFAFAGVGINAGIQDYLKIVNDAGGISGRKIKYVFEDTGYKVDTSVAAFNKLTSQEKVSLYYGDSTAFSKTINSELMRRASMIMAGASFASDLNNPKEYPYQFIPGPDYTADDRHSARVHRQDPRRARGSRSSTPTPSSAATRSPATEKRAKELGLDGRRRRSRRRPPASTSPPKYSSCAAPNPDYTIFHGYVLAPLPEFMSADAKQLGLKSEVHGHVLVDG